MSRLVGKRVILVGGAVLLAVALIGYAVLHASIQASVRQEVGRAEQAFPQAADPVEALLAVVQADRFAVDQRNRAVWALGRLGDQRALPVLIAKFHPEHCDHGRELCQHELAKAIKLCEGRTGN